MLTSALSSMKISRFDDQGNQSDIFLWLEACRSLLLARAKSTVWYPKTGGGIFCIGAQIRTDSLPYISLSSLFSGTPVLLVWTSIAGSMS